MTVALPRDNRVRMRTLITVCSLAVVSSAAFAQELSAPSPRSKIEQRVGVTDFAIEYSSPGVKGRPIWGELVPYDKPWRTGANAATKITASTDFSFGGKTVPAGSYSLYTIPTKTGWTVALNSSADGWGTNGLDIKKDVARAQVKSEAIPLRERMTFIFSDASDSGVRLDMEWEKVRVMIPISVDTTALVTKNIDKALGDTWRPHYNSGRWLFDNNGDLTKALGYLDASIAIKPTWSNNWTRAQILAKQGKGAEALASAEKAQTLGKGEQIYETVYKEQIAKAIADWKKKS